MTRFAAPIIVIEPNHNGTGAPHIKQVSQSAAQLLGYEEIELIDKTIDSVFITEDKALWQSIVQKCHSRFNPDAAPSDITFEESYAGQLITKSKNKTKILVSISPLFEQTLNDLKFVLLLQHIGAEQINTESALIESEERFRQMAEMTGEWLWEQNADGYYSYCSSAVKQILGYEPEEVIGRHYTEFLSAQDKMEQQNYAGSNRPFYALLSHYRHKDGRQILTESTGLPIINAEGKLFKWRGVDRDVTAKKHFQDALIESEQRIRLIIESSLSAIVIMDSYGIINDWNRPAEKMFGWSKNEAVGQRLESLIIPPRFRENHRRGLEQFLRSGRGPFMNQLLEHIAIRRDGNEFPVELSISPLRLGNSYIFSGFIHDISKRKSREQQIRQAQINLAIAQNEIKIAQRIQASLSPGDPIECDQFEVTGFCLPADQVGGDYYDYFYRNEEHLDMIIADVSGHSIGPALFMVETRSAVRTQANNASSPSETLRMLNSFLFDDLDKSDYFITLFYLQYDIKQNLLRFANAGHPTPLLIGSDASECKQLDADGLILGVQNDIVFEEKAIPLSPGDIVLLYTDGLTEAENPQGEFFGLERVYETLKMFAQKPPQVIIEALLTQLKQFSHSESFNDDITLMIFKKH